METSQVGLPFSPEGGKEKKYVRPPKLRLVVSISSYMPAEIFYRLLKERNVTALLDTRLTRNYDGAHFTHESDFAYLTAMHGIEYMHAQQFSPTQAMRKVFDETFKSAKGENRDSKAWTNFLQSYEQLMIERKPLQDQAIKKVLYGPHEAVAVLCSCQHHDDCHRSYACGIMVNYVDGLSLDVAYPTEHEPNYKSPRRYRLTDFPHAGLRKNGRGVRP